MTVSADFSKPAATLKLNDDGLWVELSINGKSVAINLDYVFCADAFCAEYRRLFDKPKPAAEHEAKAPEWNGEGLPPVGAVCEYQRNAVSYRQTWVKVTVKYISLSLIVLEHFAGKNKFIESSNSCAFRPIRTPEQIAADERESFIDRCLSIAEKKLDASQPRAQAGKLYDKGCRFSAEVSE